MIIHVGDFAYDMATDNGRVGNEFMQQIQPIAAYVPYMTCVGNHEYYEDFNMSSYKAHFSMPEERYIFLFAIIFQILGIIIKYIFIKNEYFT